MSGRTVTKEEKAWLKKRIVEDHIHPYDLVDELNKKFEGNRTYNGLTVLLSKMRISFGNLIRAEYAGKKEVPERIVAGLSEQQMRAELGKRGYKVEKLTQDKMDKKFRVDPELVKGDSYKFAVISCTQIGSVYQQMTYLKNFYKYVEDQGVKVVLHCGDLVDGCDVYKGQEYELFLHGSKAQRDYVVEYYPKIEGGKTIMIAGNHDYSFYSLTGEDILESIGTRRPDMEYVGVYGAYPQIGPLNIYIQHGGGREGAGAYARSYRMQKNIEQFSPKAKPDFYFLGHFHTTCQLFEYRNVFGMMVPCFQSQTPFLRRVGLYPEIGGYVLEIKVNDNFRKAGMVSVKTEFIPFYVPIEEDY